MIDAEKINVEDRTTSSLHTDLRICRYGAEAIPEILKLVKVTLGNEGAVRKTEAFWRWKHEDNYFGPSYGLYSWDEAQALAAGLRVLMRWRFRDLAGQELSAVRAVDTATHPAYQRQGIFSKLTRQALADLKHEGVDLIFNTPNASSLPGYLKMGWQIVAKWPVYIRALRPIRMLLRKMAPKPASPPAVNLGEYFTPTIMTWQTFAARYGAALQKFVSSWETQRAQVGFRTPRGVDYLQWRYGQHPHLAYGFFALEDTEGLAGVAILRPNWRYGWQEVVLTELFLRQPDLRLGKTFFKNLIMQLQADYLIAHFPEPSFEKALLKQTGFYKVPAQGMTFTIHPLSSRSQSGVEARSWDLTLGDLEIF